MAIIESVYKFQLIIKLAALGQLAHQFFLRRVSEVIRKCKKLNKHFKECPGKPTNVCMLKTRGRQSSSRAALMQVNESTQVVAHTPRVMQARMQAAWECVCVCVQSVCCCTQLGLRLLHIMHCTRTALALLGVGVARRGMAVASFAFQTKLQNLCCSCSS